MTVILECDKCGAIGTYDEIANHKCEKTWPPINLPVIDFTGCTQGQQIRKIGEEYGEVAEALVSGNPLEVIRESLDCIQTHWTLINMVAAEFDINIDKLYQEHCRKLIKKGYLR